MLRLLSTASSLLIVAAASLLPNSVTAQEVLRAAGTGAGLPYHAFDAATNTHSGIIVDLLNAIAVEAGFTIEYLAPLSAADLVPAVAAGNVDITASNVGITAARLEQIAFSVPFHNASEALVVLNTDNSQYLTLQDLSGETVGTVRGSLYDNGLNAITGVFREVKLYANVAEVAQAVLSGEIKAGVLSSVPIEYALAQGQFAGVKVVAGYQTQFNSQLGIGISKSRPDLVDRVNTVLTRMISDGSIGQFFANYGITWVQP